MCYSVYISTDSSEDLTKRNTEFVRFEKLTDTNNDPCTRLLDFPNRWYIGSKSGCSCSFRHLLSTDLGFAEPVDWYKEEKDDITATSELYGTLDYLLSSGHQVDILDAWQGARPDNIKAIDVTLDVVREKAFRLFENHRFILKKENSRLR